MKTYCGFGNLQWIFFFFEFLLHMELFKVLINILKIKKD